MAEFSYRAVDNNGKGLNGVMNALDEATLEALLKESGYWLVSAHANSPTNKNNNKRKLRLKRRDLIDISMGLAPMLKAGVPLVETLHELASESGNPDVQWILNNMEVNIRSGGTMSEVMDAWPTAFPTYMRYLVRAGEQSGNLAESFIELRRYLEWVEKLAGQVKQASIYPTLVIVVVSLFIVLLFTFVVPRFAELLTGLNIPLPLPTRLVMLVGDFMSQWWLGVIAMPLAVWLMVRMARKHITSFARRIDELKLSLPVFGEINRMLALSRFAHHFAVLYRAGIPLLEILEMIPHLVGNEAIARALDVARLEISEGSTMTESMSKQNVFSPMLLRMISVGENTGGMDTALANVAEFYDEEIPRRINQLFGIVEPAIIVVLVGVVGGVALALFMPMMSLMSAVK